MIDIDMKTTKYIPTTNQCYGIIHMLVYVRSKGIIKLNPLDGSSTAIIQFNLSSGSYIEMLDNNLYYTNAKTVSCCDMNGKAFWTFKDENILMSPRGIAVDNSGNV